MRSLVPTYRKDDAFGWARPRLGSFLVWLSRLSGRSEPPEDAAAYPPIDAKTVLYAVGDIHGRADLLLDLHRRIDEDWQDRPGERRLEIYLGDYVDRGPDSAAVIDLLRERVTVSPIMPLMGNHEMVLLHFLEGGMSDPEWIDWGGATTALSYGVDPTRETVLSAAMSRAVPPEHVHFLKSLRTSFRYGPYFFAHAGVMPSRDLESQRPNDLLWIRKPFLEHQGSFGAIVVHGHTPHDQPEFRTNRINLDTGAYKTGRLTCLRIDSEGVVLVD